MELVVLVARLALAVTFLLSAVAKWRDQDGARQAVKNFGIPSSLAPAIAVVLAPLELASAVLLLTTGWGVVAGALLAVAVLTAFTIGIIVNLMRGNRVECRCFGALSNKPLSWWSVVRNGLLIVLAVLVLTGGPDQGFVWQELADIFAPLSTAEAWLSVAVAGLIAAVVSMAAVFLQLLQRYGSVLLRVEALEAAAEGEHVHPQAADFQPWEAPAFEAVNTAGASVTLQDVLVEESASLFVFVSPNCEGCGELVDDLQSWQADEDGPNVVVLSPGERPAIAEKFGDVAVHSHSGALIDDYRVEFTPGAVVVSTDGFITVAPAYGSDEVRRLYFALDGKGPDDIEIGPPPVRPGDAVPDVAVEFNGSRVPVAQAAGDDSVLLFWDTTCGFCQQITQDVALRQNSTPLLLVLRGTDVDRVRESGLTAPIAIDPGFTVGNALQAPGTPVAVRVREGKIASTVAVGGPEVLDLLAAVRVIG